MRYLSAIALVALSFAFAVSAAEAQSTKQGKNARMTQDQQIEARHQCFLEAQAAAPGAGIGSGEQQHRTAVYTSCAQRKGVRP